MTSAPPPRIGVTAGCPAGVGPELLAAGLLALPPETRARWIFFGPPEVLRLGAERAGLAARRAGEGWLVAGGGREVQVACATPDAASCDVSAGRPDEAALRVQGHALEAACQAAARGEVDALCTGPLRKGALQALPGGPYPGQTEFCHAYLAVDDQGPLMCFLGGPFVLGLATVHIPLRDVPARLTPALLDLAIARLDDLCRHLRAHDANALAPASPRLAVLGLNPHAGEGGLLGCEENDVIAPALAHARRRGVDVRGPLPADGFFARVHRATAAELPDGVLALFHDQGLCAYKVLSAGRGVNLTWGLRVPRTSPDHGTADDLAGTGRADVASTAAALGWALRLAGVRASPMPAPAALDPAGS